MMGVTLVLMIVLIAIDGSRGLEMDALSTVRQNALDLETSLWSKVLDPRWEEVTEMDAQGPDISIARACDNFTKTLAQYDSYANSYEDTSVARWWAWGMISTSKHNVEKVYIRFRTFMRHQASQRIASPHKEWIALAESVVDESSGSVKSAMDDINKLIIHGHFYRQILKESNAHMCESKQSQNQLLYNMYDTILLTEIKGYMMMQFSWMLLKLYGRGNFTEESNIARKRYEERTGLTVAAVKSALSEANRALWRCDPARHVEGETYVQLTRLLQGYIENEVDMNSEETCRENCAFYSVAENHGCFKEQFCSRQSPCSGKILSCRYIDSDMTICLASHNSNRRYEWIEYENGKILGKKSYCSRGTTKVDSWWRWLFWHCSYCMCICDQPGSKSDRYFSLRESKSDVDNNKVITGLRFVKHKRVIHLQISEGTLLPGAIIDANSVTWRPVEDINVMRAKKNVDYHEMSNEERAFDLDDLEGPAGYILTGVRFRKLGAHLNFEIQTMPFNFTTGEIHIEKATWVSSDKTAVSMETSEFRTELRLPSPDVPTKALLPSEIDSESDQYVVFTHSDMDTDGAQTTVPFIDTQPVISSIPVPLTGAGMYHKGQRRYGGFIGPKIFTYDYSPHIQSVHSKVGEDVINDNLNFVISAA